MKFLPLWKRFGFFVAILIWRTCKKQGHDWHNVLGSQYKTCSFVNPNGSGMDWFSVKMRCRCCETVRLVDLCVSYAPDGSYRITSPHGTVVIT